MEMATTAGTAAPRPLDGVTVLELSARVSGSYCGRLLADMGAAVTRAELPFAAEGTEAAAAALRRSLRAGKESVTVEEAIAAGLAAKVDLIVADSIRDDAFDGAAVAATARVLADRGDDTLLTDISDFGAKAPFDERPGTPLTVSGWSCASWSVGATDREPLSLSFDLPDYMTGTEAAGASILALLRRDEGARATIPTEVAAADVIAYYVGMMVSNFLPYGRPWHRDGARASQSSGFYPAAIFPCRDGAMVLTCRQAAEWEGLVAAMGNPEWSRDPRFADAREIARHHSDEVDPYLLEWTAGQTVAELFETAQEFGFPASPVRTVGESVGDPQFESRAFLHLLDGDPALLDPGPPYKLLAATSSGAAPPTGRTEASAAKPLAGLRVLDFTWVWSGPTVTAGLADLGAEVIKVEHAGRPDPARMRGRGLGSTAEGPETEVSPYFNQLNRGKRSIAVDITSPEGAATIRALVAECDVVVESMRPGTLARRGLGWEQLSEINPRLVMLSMAVLGQTGPLSHIKGYAMVMGGLSGAEALIAYERGRPMGLLNMALGDVNASGHALAVLLGAVLRQRRTGEGCFIDLSQTECMVAILRGALLQAQLEEDFAPPANGHRRFRPHGHFAAAGEDRWLAVAVRTDAERARLAELLGSPTDEPALTAALTAWSAERSAESGAAALWEIDVPASPVNSWEALTATDWARARPLTVPVHHPLLGEQDVVYLPWEVGGSRPHPTVGAPLLGADGAAIEAELLQSPAST
jgi:crotonobetainyl-CoA:carnitine CoA-transferase CaiB-like acyl-CoA transferase